MKKKFIFLILIIVTQISCSHNEDNKASSSTTVNKQIDTTAHVYQLFPTQNMWTFIKLNTRNGKLWQVQYDVSGNNRFEIVISSAPLVILEEELNDRFMLYPTENMYTFILLDQIDGRMWQVQWSMESDKRFIIPF